MKTIMLILFLAAGIFKTSESCAQVNVQDSLALVDFYNSTNGAGWFTPWTLTQPVTTWYGVGLDINKYHVISLDMEVNNLGGTISPSLSNMQYLSSLILDNDKLTGTIPASLGSMPNLEYLELSGNQLTGTIPASLGNLSSLAALALANNQLSGTIPASLGNLKLNQAFDLSHNQLTGSIPPALGTFKSMAEMLLNYAEALNEANSSPVADVYTAINKIRTRAGQPALPAGITQADMRKRIENERRVELCFEGQRYWDARRWMIADSAFNGPIYGMKVVQNGSSFIYTPYIVEQHVFLPKMNLYPIPVSQLLSDTKLTQTDGW